MVSQLSPACAPSRIRNSKKARSSCSGTPHSRSWYWVARSFLAHAQRITASSLGTCVEIGWRSISANLRSMRNLDNRRPSRLADIIGLPGKGSAALKFDVDSTSIAKTGKELQPLRHAVELFPVDTRDHIAVADSQPLVDGFRPDAEQAQALHPTIPDHRNTAGLSRDCIDVSENVIELRARHLVFGRRQRSDAGADALGWNARN